MCGCICKFYTPRRKLESTEGPHFEEILLLWLAQRNPVGLLSTQIFYLFVLVYRSQSIEEFGGDNDAVR